MTRTVQALVMRAAGTNCDREALLALELAGARARALHLNRLLEAPARLDEFQVLVIPGGFSYGDYVAAGRLWACELRERLSEPLLDFVARGGFVLGICNGFQVLTETGLLEGAEVVRGHEPRALSLENNQSNRFECRWIELEDLECACPWLVPGRRWPAPVAHGEGRLAVRDSATLKRLYERRQVALRYAAPAAAPAGAPPAYPHCPNGSIDAIAGLCDPTGRVLGLMPHPERNTSPFHHPRWTRREPVLEGEGLAFFRRLVACARASLAPASV